MCFIIGKYSIEEVAEMYKEQTMESLRKTDKDFYERSRFEITTRFYKKSIWFSVTHYIKEGGWDKYSLSYKVDKGQDKNIVYSEVEVSKNGIREIISLEGINGTSEIEIEMEPNCIFEKIRKNNSNDNNIEDKIKEIIFDMNFTNLFSNKKYKELLLFLEEEYGKGVITSEQYEEATKLTKEIRLENLFK